MKIYVRRGGLNFGPYSFQSTNRFLEEEKLSHQDLSWCGDLNLEGWIPLADLLLKIGSAKQEDGEAKVITYVEKIKKMVSKGEWKSAKDLAIPLGRKYPDFFGELLKQCCMDDEGNFYLPPWIRTFDGERDETRFILSVLPSCMDAKGLDESLRISNIKALNLEFVSEESDFEISLLSPYVNLNTLSVMGIELSGGLEELAGLPELKSLDLNSVDALEELSDFRNLPALQEFKFSYGESLKSVDVQDHQSLTSFEVNNYWSSLNDLRVANCPSLEQIELNFERLDENPIFSNLPNLESLYFSADYGFTSFSLDNCPNLRELILLGDELSEISGLENLLHLEHLELGRYADSGLQKLSLEGCNNMESLDLGYGMIHEMNLSGCELLTYVYPPTDISLLNLSGCRSLEDLDLRWSQKLKQLNISGCSELLELWLPYEPNLLEELELEGCHSLERVGIGLNDSLNDLSFLSECSNLLELYVLGLGDYEDLSFLDCSSELELLQLGGCLNLKNLDGLSAVSSSLDSLMIGDLEQLEELDFETGFPQLSIFDLHAPVLKNLNFLSQMPNLLELNLNCESLNDTEGLKVLNQLEKLEITNLPDDSIDAFAKNPNLKELQIYHCPELESISALSGFTDLETLSIQDCCKLKDLNPTSMLGKLRTLDLYLQENSQGLDFSPLGKLLNLRELTLCSNELVDVTWIASVKKLVELNLNGCESLESLRGLSVLSKLNSLNLGLCPNLIDLDELSSLSELKELYLYHCSSLECIAGIENLYQLEHVDLCGCEMITEEQVRELVLKLPDCYIQNDFI